MMVGVLRAVSEYAKANGAPSGPDIVLKHEVTHIGRNVPKAAGLPLPMTLAQVSGKHCQVIGDPHQGYKVYDTSTNGSYIVRTTRVPKDGSLPIATGDVLRLSTVSAQNPSAVLEYRLEVAAEETRVRKADDAPEANGATPVKRLCMSTVSGTPDREAEAAKERKLNQLLATNKELQSKLGEARSKAEAARNQLDAKAAEAQQLTAELAATRLQGEAAVAAAAANAAQQSDEQIKELSAAKAGLAQQLEQQQQAVRAQEETTASLRRDLETRQEEVQQLKQQLTAAQQHKDDELQALKDSEAGLQERVAAVAAEADELRDQLRVSAQELQELRGQADMAGEKEQQAIDEAALLRQQLTSAQREARDAVTKMGDMNMAMQVLRDEVTVNEERFNGQLQQWRKVAKAQRKVQEAQAAALDADREMAAAVSALGNAVVVNQEKAVAALDQAVSPLANSGAAQFDDTQHTLEASSYNPATSRNPANGAAAAGTQAASSALNPAAAAAGQAVQQPDVAATATAELEDTHMQHLSIPEDGAQLDAAKSAAEHAGDTAASYEPGQKVDTMGRLTDISAVDTQANGGADGSQAADSEEHDGDADEANPDEAVPNLAGDNAPVGQSPAMSADPPRSSNPAGEEGARAGEDEAGNDGGAASEHVDGEGNPVTSAANDDRDEDEDDEMEVDDEEE